MYGESIVFVKETISIMNSNSQHQEYFSVPKPSEEVFHSPASINLISVAGNEFANIHVSCCEVGQALWCSKKATICLQSLHECSDLNTVWKISDISFLESGQRYRIVSCIRRTFFHGGEYQKSGVRLIYEYSKTRHLFLGHTERNVTAIHFRR